jgi:hypothetical protein
MVTGWWRFVLRLKKYLNVLVGPQIEQNKGPVARLRLGFREFINT